MSYIPRGVIFFFSMSFIVLAQSSRVTDERTDRSACRLQHDRIKKRLRSAEKASRSAIY
jgi:hypothetical protein